MTEEGGDRGGRRRRSDARAAPSRGDAGDGKGAGMRRTSGYSSTPSLPNGSSRRFGSRASARHNSSYNRWRAAANGLRCGGGGRCG